MEERHAGQRLFLVGFLVLFLELACIRWFATHVIFLTFFTNVVLIAAFLGMSCGCLAAARKRDWLGWTPLLLIATLGLAVGTYALFHLSSDLVVGVGERTSPDVVFFGTTYRDANLARFVVPIEIFAAIFFVLIALVFVGLGQALGRAFDAYPSRVGGYTLNITGSLAGIAAFAVLSMARTTPLIWFGVALLGIGYLLRQTGSLTPFRALTLAASVILAGVPVTVFLSETDQHWSPYYAVRHDHRYGEIKVNDIAHQRMHAFEDKGAVYSLPYLLRRDAGKPPFEDVLIIGAGSGNDVTHALRHGVKRVDAVEIDPVIQEIGAGHHPDRPYQDPRVTVRLDDGRHHLRTTDRRYDLIVYALVDSLVLHSGFANIRLESFLFTEEAFQDVKRCLAPGGVFAMYNYYRHGWIVHRASALTEKVFGAPPVVIGLPYVETIAPEDATKFTAMLTGDTAWLRSAFEAHEAFWLDAKPPNNLQGSGFTREAGGGLQRIQPARLIEREAEPLLTTDDWPHLYMRGRFIPGLTIRSMLLLGLLGLVFVYLFLPGRAVRLDNRMFWLGAGFMLLETKAVVHMALLFGSTWLVNTVVFFAVLVMILLANLFVLKGPRIRDRWIYAGLLLSLVANVVVPLNMFLEGGAVLRHVIPSLLVFTPIFFAGIVFAQSFRDVVHADHAFGSNIAGAVVGGIAESFSVALGFRHLLLVAIAFYLVSILRRRVAGRAV